MKIKLAALLLCTGIALQAQDITVFPEEVTGRIKPMNGVNGGPLRKTGTQSRSNMDAFKAAHIPFCRTHDASFYNEIGGEHIIDITMLFPDFSKDVDDPASYDFLLTDLFLQSIIDADSKVFFRLGQKIQHLEKKYGIYPPEDFQKWAEICEHIVRHYNCGWADGLHLDIRYWEIWNEADNDKDRWQTNPECWGGSEEQFFELYCTAARHLKKCHPDIKVGGPAVAYGDDWGERFLAYMKKHHAPVDFYTWHSYETETEPVRQRILNVREMIDRMGFESSEMIISEWNFVRGWGREYLSSLKSINAMEGAAYSAAFMSMGQDNPVDALLYYDVFPGSSFNGAFDTITNEPKQGYYPLYAWSKLARLGTQIKVVNDNKGIYATAARDGNGKIGMLIIRYSKDDREDYPREISISVPGKNAGEVFGHLTDEYHMFTEKVIPVANSNSGCILSIKLRPYSFIYLEF